MEKSFKLTLDTDKPDALRAELVFSKTDGRTVITVAMTVGNQTGHLPLMAAQADVIRMAMADLQEEHDLLQRTLAAHTSGT